MIEKHLFGPSSFLFLVLFRMRCNYLGRYNVQGVHYRGTKESRQT